MAKRTYTGYTGNKSNGKGIEKLVDLSLHKWKTSTCLGTYAHRPKRGKTSMSVHADYRAADIKFGSKAERLDAVEWFSKIAADACRIELVCDYSYRGPLRRAYGRIWDCVNRRWMPLAKGAVVGGGEAWATYLHIEIAPGALAESGSAMEAAWRSVSKPKG